VNDIGTLLGTLAVSPLLVAAFPADIFSCAGAVALGTIIITKLTLSMGFGDLNAQYITPSEYNYVIRSSKNNFFFNYRSAFRVNGV
jgi:hypothetical protein